MKKLHLFKRTLLLLALIVGCCNVWGADVVITPTATSGTSGSYSWSTAKNNGQTNPTYSGDGDLRIYAKGSITISTSGNENMTTIVFAISTQGKKRLAPITANVGTITTQTKGDETVTWTGKSKSVTFTVGDKADYGSESSKAGQLCFTTMTITSENAKTLTSISVTTNPEKTAYKIGETLDLNGIVVTGTFDDSSTEDVTSKCSFDPVDGAVLGTTENQNVAISYNDKNCNLPITVASVTSLAVKTAPTTVKYRITDGLDLTGLVLTATYSDSESKVITEGFTALPANGTALNTAGDNDVTLSYYGQNCTQRVTVGNLSSITYNATGVGAFANTTYTEKDTFNPEGLVVTAHFDNDLDVVVASGYTLSHDTETELKTTDKNVTISYTWNEVEKTVNIPITVNAGTKYTVSFDAGNGTYTGGDKPETEYQGGVEMPTPTGIPSGWNFYGWAEAKQTEETNEAPSVTAAGATYYPTANVTLYAVYSLVEGGEKTITATDMSGANSSATTLKTGHPITYKVSNGAYSNPMRWYSGGILTMAGATMSKIQFTMNGSYSASEITLNAGGGAYSNGTWTGESSEVKFSASSQVRIDEIKVTYTSSSTVYTSLPAPKAELSYAETEYDAALGRSFTKPTLTNTNGVTVTYESEDEDVATVDEETGDVTIEGIGTTTITASFAGNASYRKNSASYTLNVIYGNIAQIKELTSTSTPVNFNALLQDAVVTYVSGNHAYIQDASGAVYASCGSSLTAGKKINGAVSGSIKAANQIDEITAIDLSDAEITDGVIPAALTKTVAEVSTNAAALDGQLVTINAVTIDKPSTTTTLRDGSKIGEEEATITMYSPNGGASVTNKEKGNFTGYISFYNGTNPRINLYEQSQFTKTHNVPENQVMSFANSSYNLDEETDAVTSFEGQEATKTTVKGAVTYSIKDGSDDIITYLNSSTGAVVLNGDCGTATIVATAAAYDEYDEETGYYTPYKELAIEYSVTVRPRYTVTFSINGNTDEVRRQESYGAAITVPDVATIGDYVFQGWSDTEVATTDVAPTMTTGNSITPTSTKTVYAVFANQTQTGTTDVVDQEYSHSAGNLTVGGTYTNKSSYYLLHEGGYVESAEFDLSIITKIEVTGGTYGSSSNNSLTISDGTNKWMDVTVSTSGGLGTDTYTGGAALSGTGKLRITSTCGGATNGVRVSGFKIYKSAPVYGYSNYTTSLSTSVTIGESHYLSYCFMNKLDFSETDVKAYKASVNNTTGKVTLNKVDIVPAEEGVILYCETPGTYAVPVTTEAASDVTGNEMVGVLTRTQVLWESGGKYNYILQQGQFNKATDGYLKPNRAYLQTSYNVDAEARALEIVFDEGETTGITNANVNLNANDKYFNLNGQRVATPVKGNIYIVNGKKVMFK